MSVNLSPLGGAGWQFLDNSGNVLSGGLLYTYSAGTTTPLTTYQDATGTTANANPVVLDAAGRVSGEVWLTAGLNYKFVLKTSTGTTLWTADNISGGTDAAASVLAQLAASGGSSLIGFLQSGTGAVATTVQSKLRETVSVLDFGADPTGVADSTAAIQAAIDYLRGTTRGGTLYFPNGTYNVTSINASHFGTAFDKNLRITGDGVFATRVIGTSAGKIVLDCLGSNNIELEEFYIGTTAACQAGILLARSTTSQNCNGGRITNVSVEGSFTKAALVSIASESNVLTGCRFANTNASANYTCLYTNTNDDIGMTSDNGTLFASSNTDNRAYGCTFYAPFNNANVCVFQRSAGWAFYSPLVITGGGTGGKLAHYKVGPSLTIFKGPVEWFSPLFEGQEPVVHYLEGTSGQINYFYFIKQDGGYVNVYTSSTQNFLSTNHNAGTSTFCYLFDSEIQVNRFNGSKTVQAVASAFSNAVVDIYCADATSTTIQALTFQSNSVLRAATVLENASGDYQATSYGTAAPSTGTYKAGHFRWNLDSNSLQYNGLMGWQCVASGSPGTWAPIYRGILSGSTGSRPGGTKPTGLQFYDTTLTKPVWWDGTNWRDAAGTVV